MSRDGSRDSNLLTRILLWLVVFYREGISPLTPPSCRFEPTCSEYALEALRLHGAIRGTGLTLWRILRCAPWSRGGWDPVPLPKGLREHDEHTDCEHHSPASERNDQR